MSTANLEPYTVTLGTGSRLLARLGLLELGGALRIQISAGRRRSRDLKEASLRSKLYTSRTLGADETANKGFLAQRLGIGLWTPTSPV